MSSEDKRKIIDFKEEQALSKGEITSSSLISNLSVENERGTIDTLVYVVKLKDGTVHLGNNNTSSLEVLGLLECGKSYVIDDMYE